LTPLTAEDRKRLLDNPPPEREDDFPHLADLSPSQLLERRWSITQQAKALEHERLAIDAELQAIYSDSELRFGLRGSGGWLLKKRTRTSWAYEAEVKEAITAIQKKAQQNRQAQQMVTTYLAFTQGA
jgi:hypothetical protein